MKKKIIAIVSAIMCLSMMFTITCDAAHYTSYEAFETIGKRSGCKSMQGMAVGATWIYTAKVKGDNTRQVLYKTNRKTGETVDITNSNGEDYFTDLGHANDMTPVSIDGKTNLFVATLRNDDYALVRVEVNGTEATQKANFALTYNDEPISVAGISVYKKTSTKTTLIFKNGTNFYKGVVKNSATSGTIELSLFCTIDISNVVMKGVTYDFSTWIHQGFDYDDGKLYVPYYDGVNYHTSVIIVYDYANRTRNHLTSMKDLSFMLKSNKYAKLEIESCGICSGDGRLYINTNRKKDVESSTRYDGIHYIKNFTVS